ncbi:MAG: pyruvate kinase alpha/beta domain-containing protein [Anaerolineae bacterium]|nr:pyruvate kinase alpha/beta domain-containing protein [Anaerolineae bacterium]
MSGTRVPVVYFDRPGPENTEETLRLARERADALGISHVLVATTSGATGRRAAEVFRGYHVVAVTHSTGFARPNEQELLEEHRQAMQEAGVDILTCQHALGGVNRAVRKKLGTYELDEIIAYTLRVLGEGTKVACEMAMMAADAGRVPTGEPVLAIAGTGHGADTALLLIPANAQQFFDLRVQEFICKPAFRG